MMRKLFQQAWRFARRIWDAYPEGADMVYELEREAQWHEVEASCYADGIGQGYRDYRRACAAAFRCLAERGEGWRYAQ